MKTAYLIRCLHQPKLTGYTCHHTANSFCMVSFPELKNLAASHEVLNPNPVKSFAASGGEFDPKGLKKLTKMFCSRIQVRSATANGGLA